MHPCQCWREGRERKHDEVSPHRRAATPHRVKSAAFPEGAHHIGAMSCCPLLILDDKNTLLAPCIAAFELAARQLIGVNRSWWLICVATRANRRQDPARVHPPGSRFTWRNKDLILSQWHVPASLRALRQAWNGACLLNFAASANIAASQHPLAKEQSRCAGNEWQDLDTGNRTDDGSARYALALPGSGKPETTRQYDEFAPLDCPPDSQCACRVPHGRPGRARHVPARHSIAGTGKSRQDPHRSAPGSATVHAEPA